GDAARIHPLQGLETLARAAEQDAIDEAVGLVLAQRIGEHRADVLVGAYADGSLGIGFFEELPASLGDFGFRERPDTGHPAADSLNVFGTQVLKPFGRRSLP